MGSGSALSSILQCGQQTNFLAFLTNAPELAGYKNALFSMARAASSFRAPTYSDRTGTQSLWGCIYHGGRTLAFRKDGQKMLVLAGVEKIVPGLKQKWVTRSMEFIPAYNFPQSSFFKQASTQGDKITLQWKQISKQK